MTDPEQPSTADSDWAGVSLYFGEYKQGWFGGEDPVKWRVLDAATTEYGGEGEPTILLLSDKVLASAEFAVNPGTADGGKHADGERAHYANEYAHSNIRKWLNSEPYEPFAGSEYFQEGFYQGAFSDVEQNAIAVSVKKAGGQISGYGDNSGLSQKGTCDKVFLLSADEALNPLYGFFPNIHVDTARPGMLEVSSYAGKHGVEEEKEIGAWWLRSSVPNSNSIVYYVNPDGRIGTTNAGGGFGIGVAPAVNIKLSAVAFTRQYGKSKDAAFGMASAAGENAGWELALWGGEGFAASWAGEEKRTVLLKVDAVGTPDAGVEYTQLSAMLVDGEGTVFGYGRIGKTAKTGEVKIEIPEKIPAGTYGLKVFAEDVNGGGCTDFVSNMVEFTVQVLDAGIAKGMPTLSPTPTLTPSLTLAPTLTLAPSPTSASKPTLAPTQTSTITPTLTLTPTSTLTPTPTLTLTPTPTPVPTPTLPPTPTPAPTPTQHPAQTPTVTQNPTGLAGSATEGTEPPSDETSKGSGKIITIVLLFGLAIAVGCGGGIVALDWFRKKNQGENNHHGKEK